MSFLGVPWLPFPKQGSKLVNQVPLPPHTGGPGEIPPLLVVTPSSRAPAGCSHREHCGISISCAATHSICAQQLGLY